MLEEKCSKLVMPSGTIDQQKKRKKKSKRNKAAGEKAALFPLTSQNASAQSHLQINSVSRKMKNIHKETSHLSPEICEEATESLRWEGVLQDPKAETERLEQYRAHRRQRYVEHRQTLIKQTHEDLRHKLFTQQETILAFD